MDQLFEILDRLAEADLRRFKTFLCTQVDFRPIPKGKLENSDATDVAMKMTEAYGPHDAMTITRNILRRMNMGGVV